MFKLFLPVGVALLFASAAYGQVDAPAQERPVTPSAASTPAPAAKIKIPEGTELRIRFNDALSSATNKDGDEFSIELDDDVTLSDGTNIRAGYCGKGEITGAEKKRMLGKAGELNMRLDYNAALRR